MNRKAVSGIILMLLLSSMLTLAFSTQPVRAIGPIYIRPDGSVDPPTAPIQQDVDVYTFTDNIYDSIVVERDNIVVEGSGYTVKGPGIGTNSKGIVLSYRRNVTIKNTKITDFDYGIYTYPSLGLSTLYGNTLTNNRVGIWHSISSYNTISRNNITSNEDDGIVLRGSSHNTISGNNITDNSQGIELYYSSNNTISENYIVNRSTEAGFGFCLWESTHNMLSENNIYNNYGGVLLQESSDNKFYHNSFANLEKQVDDYSWYYPDIPPSINMWDNGYPSGGNYWSDYEERHPDSEELDGSGIWDTPYVIDEHNQDNYPLMEPWTPLDELKTEIEGLGSQGEIDNQGIVKSLIAKLNVAQKLVDKGKIDEAESILEEDFIPQVKNLTDIHITKKAAEVLIESAEYIISHL